MRGPTPTPPPRTLADRIVPALAVAALVAAALVATLKAAAALREQFPGP
jgi:hypothetical protein